MVSNQGAAITLNCKTAYHLILTCHQQTGVPIKRQNELLSHSMENLDTMAHDRFRDFGGLRQTYNHNKQ